MLPHTPKAPTEPLSLRMRLAAVFGGAINIDRAKHAATVGALVTHANGHHPPTPVVVPTGDGGKPDA